MSTEASTTISSEAAQGRPRLRLPPAGGGPHPVGGPDSVNKYSGAGASRSSPTRTLSQERKEQGRLRGQKGHQAPEQSLRPAPPHAAPPPTDAPKSQVHREAVYPSTVVASGTRLTLRWRARDVTAPVPPWVGPPGLAPPTQALVSELVDSAPAHFSLRG